MSVAGEFQALHSTGHGADVCTWAAGPVTVGVPGLRGAGGLPHDKGGRRRAGGRSHCSSFGDEHSEAGGEGRAENKFRFIVETGTCVAALKSWFYVCV